jgi:hypothetical protein
MIKPVLFLYRYLQSILRSQRGGGGRGGINFYPAVHLTVYILFLSAIGSGIAQFPV